MTLDQWSTGVDEHVLMLPGLGENSRPIIQNTA